MKFAISLSKHRNVTKTFLCKTDLVPSSSFQKLVSCKFLTLAGGVPLKFSWLLLLRLWNSMNKREDKFLDGKGVIVIVSYYDNRFLRYWKWIVEHETYWGTGLKCSVSIAEPLFFDDFELFQSNLHLMCKEQVVIETF